MLTLSPSWNEAGIWGKNKLTFVNFWVKETSFLSVGEVIPSIAGLLISQKWSGQCLCFDVIVRIAVSCKEQMQS